MKATLSSACILILVLGLSLCFAVPRQAAGAALAAPYTDVSGEINADTTWSLAESPYVVTGDVTVMPGVTLTIEPGVQVRFNGNYALGVRGTLIAEGLAGLEILFTSNLSTPAPGDWGVLDFRSDSKYSHVQYAIIEYGGNAYKPGSNCATGAVCVNTSSFVLEDSIVRHSPTRGVSLAQSSATLANNTFEHITWEAIRLHACDLNIGECHPTIVGNDFSYTQYPILHVAPLNPVLSGNTATDNQINGYVFYVSCNVAGTNTWYAGDLPYVVPAAGGWCLMGVWDRPTTVNIQPGTIVKLENSLQFHYSTVVTATGTAEAPIIFTSLKDDSVGGDTNNDGGASSPAKRDWGMIDHFGDQVRGSYEHAIFRYGGGYPAAFGPTVNSDSGATVVVRRSQISQSGGAGAHAYNASNLTLVESEIYDHRDTCIEVATTTGSVLIENNRIQGCPSGVLVTKGSPTIRGNFFEGNTIGVDVVNTFQAAPVVSPHNRFVGAGQMGVKNRYPIDGCIDARRNWWGDVSGPSDTSTATDACGMADNPGTGAAVSDGVNYSPWEGGMGRPVLAMPRCGVSGSDQPPFRGLAAAGATVSFYDNGVLLGQTIAAADDSFTWSPPIPLLDGEHSLSVLAELDGETSLPSPLLPVEVDTSLPFDPQYASITYDLHSTVYTQLLRDQNGCAFAFESVELPVFIRPGTLFTVTLPLREDLLINPPPLAQDTMPVASPAAILAADPDSNEQSNSPLNTLYITNNTGEVVTHVVIAEHSNDSRYKGFTRYEDLNKMGPGETRSIDLPEGSYDMVFVSGAGKGVARKTGEVGGSSGWDMNVEPPNNTVKVTVDNDTGKEFNEYYVADVVPDGQGGQTAVIGGNLLGDNLLGNDNETYTLPFNGDNNFILALRGVDGTYRIVPVDASKLPSNPDGTKTVTGYLAPSIPTVNVNLNIGSEDPVCKLYFLQHNAYSGNKKPGYKPVDLLELLNVNSLTGKQTIKMPAGNYYLKAVGCSGKTLFESRYAAVGGDDYDLDIASGSHPPGGVQVGDLWNNFLRITTPLTWPGNFLAYATNSPATVSRILSRACYYAGYNVIECFDLLFGRSLIDPDGYVYNADLGVSSKVTGATVTCEVYDEDYQAWSEWPAAFYESQVNPQTTASDGYYAFFVPPGLYRVTAGAPGYAGHTSPDIQVVSEIVHYNIPLEPTGAPPPGAIYLPMIIQ